MKLCKIVTKFLLIVGALNWGLVGFFKYNLVAEIFGGELATGARVIFALVGLAGISALVCCARSCCGSCSSSCGCDCGCKSCCNKDMNNKMKR